MIPSQRELFDIPDGVAYLNCAYMSPQLRAATAAGVEAVQRKQRPWTITPADFFSGAERLRGLFADLVGVDADGVALCPSASYGIATAAANLPLATGQRVVVLAEQFPSNVYPWRAAAARAAAEVVTVPRPANGDWTPGLLERIDERVAVVAVPHCHWTDGSLVDLVAVGERARAVGAALVVDASQSLGALPIDMAAVQPDFLVAVGYKWLLGPYALGYVWAAQHRREGTPLEEGWMARSGSEDFAGLVDYVQDYQPGARRYDMGEVANFTLVPMAAAALEQLGEWGVGRIAETLASLTAEVGACAAGLGLGTPSPQRRAPHLIGLRLPDDAPGDIAARLAAAGVHVSVRGRSIRVSAHLYNDEADIARLRDALAAAL